MRNLRNCWALLRLRKRVSAIKRRTDPGQAWQQRNGRAPGLARRPLLAQSVARQRCLVIDDPHADDDISSCTQPFPKSKPARDRPVATTLNMWSAPSTVKQLRASGDLQACNVGSSINYLTDSGSGSDYPSFLPGLVWRESSKGRFFASVLSPGSTGLLAPL